MNSSRSTILLNFNNIVTYDPPYASLCPLFICTLLVYLYSRIGIEGSELVPNVIYMGKRGIFSTSSDVKIAYLTGLSRRELGRDVPMCTFEPSDCSAVRDACFRGQSEYRGVDVLITTLWPTGIENDETQKMLMAGLENLKKKKKLRDQEKGNDQFI